MIPEFEQASAGGKVAFAGVRRHAGRSEFRRDTGEMSKKPPAFQFYVKEWRSSGNIMRMTLAERGVAVTLMALAWDFEEPGKLPCDLLLISKMSAIKRTIIRRFVAKYPTFIFRVESKYHIGKLVEQYENLCQFKQKQSDAGKLGNELRWGKLSQPDTQPNRSAFASASASAIAIKHTPNASESQGFLLFLENYPKDHIGVKSDALFAWLDIPSAELHFGDILSGLERWKASEQWTQEGGRYIPDAKKFIRSKKWDTNPPKAVNKNAGPDISLTFSKARPNFKLG